MPVVYETRDPAAAPLWDPARSRAPLPQPSAADVARAAELLAGARRPLVLAGAGVDRAGANDALLELVSTLGCPVIASMSGRSVVPGDCANAVYGFGGGGDLVRREADVVLVVGCRLGNLDLPFDKYWGDPERQQLVQVDIDPRDIGVTRPVALGIVADARATLEALVGELRARGVVAPEGDDLTRYRREADAWWDARFADVERWQGPGIHPAQAMRAIGACFGSDPVYVVDGGMTSLWAGWFLPKTGPRSYHGITELGMLGTGIPSAIGAKLASPERQVVCVTGDGAAGFNFMELQTAAREGLRLVVVVFAEGAWTMEEPSELAAYGRTFGTAMGRVDWHRVAEGFGCHGAEATTLAELEPALDKARAHDGPAVVCVRSDRDANRAVPGELFQRFFEVYQGPLG